MPGYQARMRRRAKKRKLERQLRAGNSTQGPSEARNGVRSPDGQGIDQGQKVAANAQIDGISGAPSAPGLIGSGVEVSPGFENGGARDARLRERAIRKGWIKPGHNAEWPLDYSLADFERLNRERNGDLTVEQKAVFAVLCDLNPANSPTVRNAAVKSVLMMRAQNQAARQHDERMDFHERALEARTGQASSGVNVNVEAGGGIRIIIPHNGRDDPPPGAIMGSFEDFHKLDRSEDDFGDNIIEGTVGP